MSNSINANVASVGQIDTNHIQVNQSLTNLKWDSRFRHPDVSILNGGVTAKLVSQKSGEKAVLGNKGYLFGTDSESISYKINQGSTIHVGFAESTRGLDSLFIGADLISHEITAVMESTIYLDLTKTELKITYNGLTTFIDITNYSGKKMYPWLSDSIGSGGMSVSIYKTARLSVYIDSDGKVVFKTSTSNGVDRPIKFDTGSASIEFTGGQLINNTIHNLLESDAGTPMVLRETGGFDVTIDATGSVTASGDVDCSNITAESLTSPGVLPLVLTSTNADSSLLSVGGDVIVKAGGSGLTVAGGTGNTTFDSTVTATSFISDSIVSTSGNDLKLFEQAGGGLTISDYSANSQFSANLSVVGDLDVNTIKSKTGSDLNLTEDGNSGIHIASGTGIVTSDSLIIAPEIKSEETADLKLNNWDDIGLEIKSVSGDATFGSSLEINSTLYGKFGLNLYNNKTDNLGISIDNVTGDVNCGADIHVNSDAIIVGTASVGPTPVDTGICFAVSDGGGSKAMLLPRTSNHTSISPVQAGMIVFNTTDQSLRLYNGASWKIVTLT